MKIVQICLCGSHNPYLGYQDSILPRYYKELGFECVTVTSEYYKEKGEVIHSDKNCIVEKGVKVIRLANKFGLPYSINNKLRLYKGVKKVLENEKPDIIFLHNFQCLSLYSIIRYCKKNLSVRVYADSHTDYINSMTTWTSKYILHGIVWKHGVKKLIPFVKKFWGVTEQRCLFMEKVYDIPREKIDLLVMGADSRKIDFENKDTIRKNIREEYNISEKDFLIVTGGKIDKKKNIHLLVKAIDTLQMENIKLLIFGKVEQDMEKSFETEINQKEFVRYIGWIDSDKVYNYFLAADLGAFPGTHSVLWEQAVGSGLPCLFKYWSGMTHVDVGGNCILLDEENLKLLDKVISAIVSDKTKYSKMKNIACDQGVSNFSYLEIAKRSIEY